MRSKVCEHLTITAVYGTSEKKKGKRNAESTEVVLELWSADLCSSINTNLYINKRVSQKVYNHFCSFEVCVATATEWIGVGVILFYMTHLLASTDLSRLHLRQRQLIAGTSGTSGLYYNAPLGQILSGLFTQHGRVWNHSIWSGDTNQGVYLQQFKGTSWTKAKSCT